MSTAPPLLQKPIFGVRIPTQNVASAGLSSIPSLLSTPTDAPSYERYPYPPPVRPRGGGGSVYFPNRGRGFGAPRPRAPRDDQYKPERRNYRDRGGSGFRSRDDDRRYSRGSGRKGSPENSAGEESSDLNRSTTAADESVASDRGGEEVRRRSRWSGSRSSREESSRESESETRRDRRSREIVEDRDPNPAPPPATVVEEREVDDDDVRYDQRGLGNLLKMMNKQN